MNNDPECNINISLGLPSKNIYHSTHNCSTPEEIKTSSTDSFGQNKQSKVLMPCAAIGSRKCHSDRVTSTAHQRIVPLTGMDPVCVSVSSLTAVWCWGLQQGLIWYGPSLPNGLILRVTASHNANSYLLLTLSGSMYGIFCNYNYCKIWILWMPGFSLRKKKHLLTGQISRSHLHQLWSWQWRWSHLSASTTKQQTTSS